jgi:DNA topoisomerase-3
MAVASAARKRKGKGKGKKIAARGGKARKTTAAPEPAKPAASPRLEEALRNWRLAEAKRRSVPAFRIMTDATLKAIAERRPSTTAELIAIPGIGMKAVESYGAAIYRLVGQAGGHD